MARRPPVEYNTVNWKGVDRVPVKVLATSTITLYLPKLARTEHKAGNVTLVSPESWHYIQSLKGLGFTLDPNYGG
tara:strand:+ start:922 stop:1146 length:225 start_codon:yes stop_codon:yes gene_type:complete